MAFQRPGAPGSSSKINGEFADGRFQYAVQMDPDTKGEHNANLNADNVRVSEAFQAFGKRPPSGIGAETWVSGKAIGKWQGYSLTQMAYSVTGSIELRAGPGTITDTALLNRIKHMTGFKNLAEVRYSALELEATVDDGNFTINRLWIDGPDIQLLANGRYSAQYDKLDVHVESMVSKSIAQNSMYLKLKRLTSFGNQIRQSNDNESDSFVRIPRMLVSGKLRKPSVSLVRANPV